MYEIIIKTVLINYYIYQQSSHGRLKSNWQECTFTERIVT